MQKIQTLSTDTKRFRLSDPEMTQDALAAHLGLHHFNEAFLGRPSMFLYADGIVAAIRVSAEEVAILLVYERCHARMGDIGSPILPEDGEGSKTGAARAQPGLHSNKSGGRASLSDFYEGDPCSPDDPHPSSFTLDDIQRS